MNQATEWLGEIIGEKGCIESHGFAMGIDENKLLRTWRERGCNNTWGVHILAGHGSLLAA
jgi:hypothetical protein